MSAGDDSYVTLSYQLKSTVTVGTCVVIGGPDHKANFKGPDGTVSPVHVPKILSGQFMEKVDAVWLVRTRPTPGTCL